ncbi:DUF2306 domain-containing protein [Streptomyces sp. NPDC002870]|uniref:DUF2306 domain-containing protein n=1 Tax=Streptomyces sp. NPDC002870 TaxID=3364666 RepID=UPI0036A9B771
MTLSSLAISGYFVGQYAQGTLDALAKEEVALAPTYASQGWPIQVTFYVHIVSAGLALILGPWQFSRRLRNRHLRVHRGVGRTYMISVALGALTGLVMSMFSSVGILGFFGFGTLSVLWGWTAWRAYRAIRERDVLSHQAWVIRNFALTYAAVTLRLWFGVLIFVQVPFVHGDDAFERISEQAYAPVPFLCWLPNLVIAELMIRRRGLPALHITSAPATGHGKPPGQAAATGG